MPIDSIVVLSTEVPVYLAAGITREGRYRRAGLPNEGESQSKPLGSRRDLKGGEVSQQTMDHSRLGDWQTVARASVWPRDPQ